MGENTSICVSDSVITEPIFKHQYSAFLPLKLQKYLLCYFFIRFYLACNRPTWKTCTDWCEITNFEYQNAIFKQLRRFFSNIFGLKMALKMMQILVQINVFLQWTLLFNANLRYTYVEVFESNQIYEKNTIWSRFLKFVKYRHFILAHITCHGIQHWLSWTLKQVSCIHLHKWLFCDENAK